MRVRYKDINVDLGDGMEISVDKAREILSKEYPEVAQAEAIWSEEDGEKVLTFKKKAGTNG